MTINVTDTVGANSTIVLDGNSKIPAIDGSQVTALDADVFTTGSLATARIDVGTTAGKILQLDSNAKIPALSGASLLNAPGPTVSTSDPTVSTNPTLGAKWINKTSGEVYICTDATAGSNVWTNVGTGSGDVQPILQSQGATYGWISGGYQGSPGSAGTVNQNQYFPFASETNATDASNMTVVKNMMAGCSSSTHGYLGGGSDAGTNQNVIEKFQFGTTNNSTDVGDVTIARRALGGAESTTHGYLYGGTPGSPPSNTIDIIEKFSFSSDGNAVDTTANLTDAAAWMDGSSSATHGYRHGGFDASNNSENIIDKWAFANSNNATDVGDLTVNRGPYQSCCNSTTHGYTVGGWSSPYTGNVIDKFTFSSDANATDVGDLPTVNHGASGVSGTDHGYACGGRNQPENTYYNNIQRFSFSSDGNATDSADLVNYLYIPSANQV